MSMNIDITVLSDWCDAVNENGKLKKGHEHFARIAAFLRSKTPLGYRRSSIQVLGPGGVSGNLPRFRVVFEKDEDSLPEDHRYCDVCERAFGLDDMRFVHDTAYCESCYHDSFASCHDCGHVANRDEMYFNDEVDDYLCESCNDDRTTRTPSLNDYSIDFLGVLDPGVEPSDGWTEFRAKGESDKVPCYGMELEINYSERHCGEKLWNVLRKRFAGGFWLVSDGSVCNGCEIVFAPHSLKSYEERGLKDVLKELADLGFRSYESGQCGLHIHAPRPEQKHGEKIQAFFSANADRIRNFAKRSPERLNQWAKIPACSGERGYRAYSGNVRALRPGKYWSVNPHGCTLEFRCFRGTLSYQRVFASLQFVDAIVTHAATTSIATMSHPAKSWLSFVAWLKNVKAYRHLCCYLERENLSEWYFTSRTYGYESDDDGDDIDAGYEDHQIATETVSL